MSIFRRFTKQPRRERASNSISATEAQRKVTYFALMQIGNQVYAGEPVEEQQGWLVPIQRWLPDTFQWNHVGDILVDRKTGELQIDEPSLEEIIRQCQLIR